MEFLSERGYQIIVESAIKLKKEEIAYFFFNQYITNQPSNINFSNKLEEILNDLDSQLEREKSRRVIFEKNKEENKKKRKINIDWDKHPFYYFNGQLHFKFEISMYNREHFKFSIQKMEELKNGYNDFKKYLKNESPSQNKSSLTLKQKTILLEEIGFFDLKGIRDLTNTKKGELLAILLDCSKKNITDCITYKFENNKGIDKEKVKSIFSKLGIEKL
jgi:hypothetical protein